MEKGLAWIFIIAIGVFVGIFAYEKYQEYRIEFAARQAMVEIQNQQQRAAEQSKLKMRQSRQTEIRRNTLCALNEDTGKCSCIYSKTGIKVSKSQAECQAIASKGMNP